MGEWKGCNELLLTGRMAGMAKTPSKHSGQTRRNIRFQRGTEQGKDWKRLRALTGATTMISLGFELMPKQLESSLYSGP